MTRPRKNPAASGIRTRDLPLSRRTPYHLANEAVKRERETETETDRQTDLQTNKQTHRHRHTDRRTDRYRDRQRDHRHRS